MHLVYSEYGVDEQYSTWIGGSILAGLSTFKKVSQIVSKYSRKGDRVIDGSDVGIGRRIQG
jgi:actin-related protein